MTSFPAQLPALIAPPAADGEDTNVLNGLATEDLPLTVEVPPIALMDGEKIVRHPDDGTEVTWTITDRRRDGDGHLVIDYSTPDGTQDSHTFPNPGQWVRVDVGQVYR